MDDRLAACGHHLVPIRSIYRWHGTVHDEQEARGRCTPGRAWSTASPPVRAWGIRTRCPASSP
ncbi:divalent cation tolerance protein CutA [Verrucosispora sp. TAA-831]|uniref:divalent cation tolerance protein CutA n=1 Tax=Verrucosispora sp. TAA-831 TaxID=3422227 RepID=UPI003D6FAE28